MMGDDLRPRLTPLMSFMGSKPLTQAIAQLEHTLAGATSGDVQERLVQENVSEELLASAFYARAEFGRINDLIHATGIALVLPRILEPGEILERLSLASGNDPSRPFDVSTDRRVAEFKLSRWDGSDAGRKRQLFKDLVYLAAASQDGRRAELYVLGTRPIRFLTTTRSLVSWALNRSADKTKELYDKRFGSTTIPIPEFTAGPAAKVKVVDLEVAMPDLFAVGK